jgi:hypothetical protein
LVLGKEYGIKVLASKTKKISGTAGDMQSDPGYTFLRVQAMFFKRGTEWETTNGKEALELSLVDSKGETYSKQFVYVVFSCSGNWCLVARLEPDVVSSSWNSWVEEISGWTQPNRGDWRTIGLGVITYFPVPETSTGFRLRYRDLPLIDLEPVPYEPPPPTYAPSPTRPPSPTYAPSPTVASKPAM